jgi:hypothetical protein
MLKMRILNEQKEEYNRKGPMILKTKLKNVKITDKLRNWKPQNFSELINQPFEQKSNFPVFTISSFKDSIKKNILTNSIISKTLNRVQDPNRTQAGMNIILNMRNRPQMNNNQNKLLDMTTIGMPGRPKSRHTEFFEEEEMKILLKQNYSSYYVKLKNFYPSFQFNHYYRTRSEQIEDYYRKYGEEGDINNRNFAYRSKIAEKNKNLKKLEEKYKQSNLLDILGVQNNIRVSPKEFRIKNDFLSRTDIVEISMIQNDLSFKTGIINKELDSILEKHGNKIYNYTEKNISLKEQLEEYLQNVKHKKLAKKEIIKNYVDNSTKIIMKGFRKSKIYKFLEYLKGLEEIRKEVKQLDIILISDDYYKIRDISNKISEIKSKIKAYRETFKIKQRFRVFRNIENKIKTYESKGEERMIEQFSINIEKLLDNCLIYKKENMDKIKNSGEIDKTKLEKWNLTKEKETANNFFFMNEDFELIESHTNKFIKYLLIYNNINTTIISDLLLSILDMFDIIIKDGMDIHLIVDIYKEVLRKIIVNNFDLIEKESNNKLVIIYIISNCYTILLSNYFYIIELLQKNLGLSIKLFDEVTQIIKEEMDKYISIVILAYLHEVMFSQDWLKFIEAINNAHKYCYMYLSNGYTNLNWEAMTNDIYQEYINYFDTNETKNLKDKISKLNWTEIDKIDLKYQQIFEVLYTSRNIESYSPEQIDITKIYKTDERNKINSYIIITSNDDNENNETEIEKKHKISDLSLLYIDYTYQVLKIFVTTTNDDRKDEIVDKLFKTTKDILMDTNNIVTKNKNSNNKIALYYSDLIVMENSLCSILDLYENEDIQLLFSDIRQSCVDIIIHSISLLNTLIINNFNSLDFENYPTVKDDYNIYVKDFLKIKDIYNEIINCIEDKDINKIFNTSFDYLFDEINKCFNGKGNINNEDGINQFKKEFNYISDTLKSFNIINVDKYLNIINKILNTVEHKKEENKNESETETKDE